MNTIDLERALSHTELAFIAADERLLTVLAEFISACEPDFEAIETAHDEGYSLGHANGYEDGLQARE
jgi:hypothetical protein